MGNILFTDEKLLNIGQKFNPQIDRILAQSQIRYLLRRLNRQKK